MKLWSPKPAELTCSFCLKTQSAVKKLIAGPKVHICDECLGLCNDIIDREQKVELSSLKAEQPTGAQAVLQTLEAAVVGQAAAKQALAAALFSHLVRIAHPKQPISVPRVLIVGPRGSGKSALARALCAVAPKVPWYHADATRMTETGYVGENVENLLGALLSQVKYPELAWEGLLVIDGLHHLAARQPLNNKRDISGAEVQRDLIRVLDGRRCEVQLGQLLRHPQATSQPFPCDRLMVVCAATLELPNDLNDASLRNGLKELGLLDELLSRFDVIVPCPRLTAAELAQLAQGLAAPARHLFEALGGTFEVLPDGARVLADAAVAGDDGAFALQAPLARLVQNSLLAGHREVRLDATAARGLVAGGF